MNLNFEKFGLWMAFVGVFCLVMLKVRPDNDALITMPLVRELALLVFFILAILGLGLWMSSERK